MRSLLRLYKLFPTVFLLTTALPQTASANNEWNQRAFRMEQERLGYCYQTYGNADCIPPRAPAPVNCVENPDHISCWQGKRIENPNYTPEEWEQIKRTSKLLGAEMPKKCTPIANNMKRCWQAWITAHDEKRPEIYPIIDLFTRDANNKKSGWEISYGKGKLLWATYHKEGEAVASINFYDAPPGQVKATVYGENGQTVTATQQQGLESIGINSMDLKDTIHPDDFKAFDAAINNAKKERSSYTKKYGE